jgi:hypothetical protein
MKATRILIAQHRAIEALFGELTRETQKPARARAASRLTEEIIAHMAGEESVFYPAVQRVLGTSFGPRENPTAGTLDGSNTDPHFMLRVQLRRVLATGVQDAAFEPRSEALRLLFAHHVEVEETVLFPQVDGALPDSQLETLGAAVLGSRPPIWLVTTESRALFQSSRPVRGVRLPAVR